MNGNLPRCGLAAAAAGAVVLGLVGGPAASAGSDAGATQASPATITMRFNGERTFFAGAKQVVAGQPLRILNTSRPQRIGPHTFSLTKESVTPQTGRQFRNCFAPGGICRKIAVAHKIDFDTGASGARVVKAGLAGWDKEFTKTAKGDSWFSDRKGASFSQKVTALPGTTLHYFCAIHPEMSGEIRVVE